MKTFENEVLTFDVSAPKKIAAMQTKLAEYGEAGFAVVSVVEAWPRGGQIVVFLTRENDHFGQEDAA